MTAINTTPKDKNSSQQFIIISSPYLRSREALRKLHVQFKNCWVIFISEWDLLRIMVFLVRGRAAETLKKSKKTGKEKTLKNEKKEK